MLLIEKSYSYQMMMLRQSWFRLVGEIFKALTLRSIAKTYFERVRYENRQMRELRAWKKKATARKG